MAAEALREIGGLVPVPRSATLRPLRDSSGNLLDRGLVIWFPGPRSVTGEDLAEFHVHGSRAVVEAMFAALAVLGCRQATPGEFTRRAFGNGKLDLDGVEGLADLLASETEGQRHDAIRRSEGLLTRRLAAWRSRLTMIAAQLEAAIDYDGEDDVVDSESGVITEISEVLTELDVALAAPPAERLRDGVRVAIVGPPNAGKSSLFNALVGKEAAIVSDIPGTTRDAIERPVVLAGIPFLFVDTAGLRDTVDPVEQIGVERARTERTRADIIVDLAAPADDDDRSVAVSPKADISDERSGGLAVSSYTGEGLGSLQERLCTMARLLLPRDGDVSFDRKHRHALEIVAADLRRAARETDLLLIAENIRSCLRPLDALIGEDAGEDILDALFGRFCLGK